MTAAFVLSGLMHEVCILYMCNALGRATDGLAAAGSQLTFFLLQPPLIVLQEALYVRLPAAWQGRWWLRVLQVSCTLVPLLGDYFFWHSFEACGLDSAGLLEIQGHMRSAAQWLQPLLRVWPSF